MNAAESTDLAPAPVLLPDDFGPVVAEQDVVEKLLTLDGATILELGCGAADKTRKIAAKYPNATVHALEVDEAQHAKNVAGPQLPNLHFHLAGAQSLPFPSRTVDVVLMFKSLHHVPADLLDRALGEIARVLKPDGMAYISEPLFAGAYNEIIRIFHDEQQVRTAAFSAILRAVRAGQLVHALQVFFRTPLRLGAFADFETGVVNVTHTQHRLSAGMLQRVRDEFDKNVVDGAARFEVPMRVDLLRPRR